MTDKDLEEFNRWHSFTCYSDDELVRLRFLESWKAACEYKQKEIDFLKDRNETLVAKVTCLNQINDGLHALLKETEDK
jgi:hypothetical protein